MIKAFIFDLDGTLVNTEPLHYRAWKKTLNRNGVSQFTFDTFIRFVGTSNEKVAEDYIKSDNIVKSVTDLVLEKQADYMHLIPEIKLMAGVRDILEKYHNTFRFSVASSSHKKEIMAILEAHQLERYFELIVGGDMVKKKKPDPEIYIKVQQALGLKPEECVAFEDSEHGLNSAKNAAMYGVAIRNEFTQNHDLSRADLVLNGLAEMDDKKIATLLHHSP